MQSQLEAALAVLTFALWGAYSRLLLVAQNPVYSTHLEVVGALFAANLTIIIILNVGFLYALMIIDGELDVRAERRRSR